jgi:hypothetical protein
MPIGIVSRSGFLERLTVKKSSFFSSLSSLLNIKDEVLTSVIVYEQKNISSPLIHAWESFIAEKKLSNELTIFNWLTAMDFSFSGIME